MSKEVKPLYRKVNTKARNHHHNTGEDAKYSRGTKKGIPKQMKQGVERGLDYTPLYRFLHSKVGQPFNEIYSEVIKRLPNKEPIYWLVHDKITTENEHGYVFIGESSRMSTMYIDEDGFLQFINPNLVNTDFSPSCWCCTHTFNGKPLTNKWK